jgi:hypothetical protein
MKLVMKIVLAGVILMILAVGGCLALVGGAANQVDKEIKRSENTVHEVTYKVTGAGKADLTFSTDTATSAQENGQKLPWRKNVKIKGDTFEVYQVMAQHTQGGGPISCQIIVDGKPKAKNTSKGQYAIADCSYTLGD